MFYVIKKRHFYLARPGHPTHYTVDLANAVRYTTREEAWTHVVYPEFVWGVQLS